MNDQGKFLEYDSGGLYIGGQTRMDAAARLAPHISCKILLVGGGIGAADAQQKWQKVHDMRQFLIRHGVDRQQLVCIASQPNTLGNLRAVYATYRAELEGRRVGVLTNFYHMPRVLRMAADAQFDWRVTFVPLIAEVQLKPQNHILDSGTAAILRQVISNIRGVKDWEDGAYEEQFTPKSLWQGEIYHADLSQEKHQANTKAGVLAVPHQKR